MESIMVLFLDVYLTLIMGIEKRFPVRVALLQRKALWLFHLDHFDSHPSQSFGNTSALDGVRNKATRAKSNI